MIEGRGFDALRIYASGAASDGGPIASGSGYLGGFRSWREVEEIGILPREPVIENLVIERASASNGTGLGTIEADGYSSVRYRAPGSATFGASVVLSEGETAILLDGDDETKGVRVRRSFAGLVANLSGSVDIALTRPVAGWLGGTRILDGDPTLISSGAFLLAAGPFGISNLRLWAEPLSAAFTTNAAQLGATGTGTIASALGSFAGQPESGFALVRTLAGAIRELVYFSSRTDEILTVSSTGHRGLTGASGAGLATDTVEIVPGLAFIAEIPAADGSIQTIADRNALPTGSIAFPFSEAEAITAATLAIGEALGIWALRIGVSEMSADADIANQVRMKFEGF